jgi:Immunity protein 39
VSHNRKLVLGGVALTMARLPAKQNSAAASRARDEIEGELVRSGFLDNAPFKCVGLIIRYGLIDEKEPHFEAIEDQFGELPLAIEIDVHRLIGVSEDQMISVYRKAILIALTSAGEKYGLPLDRLRRLLEDV